MLLLKEIKLHTNTVDWPKSDSNSNINLLVSSKLRINVSVFISHLKIICNKSWHTLMPTNMIIIRSIFLNVSCYYQITVLVCVRAVGSGGRPLGALSAPPVAPRSYLREKLLPISKRPVRFQIFYNVLKHTIPFRYIWLFRLGILKCACFVTYKNRNTYLTNK